ncbi:HAD-IA family hydrolase [Rhodobacteraceae bacterium LMO-12]|nr:HAD-IA family hydrolase [Rhodobacteraceae bacterium LMO-JJ12]
MKTVIFDLDGTLADTSGDLIAAANACFREMGAGDVLDMGRDAGTALRGGKAMLRLGMTRLGNVEEDAIERWYPFLLDAYAQGIDRHTVLYPGAMEAVEALGRAGFGVGICTNKPEALAEQLLVSLGIRDAFASLVGADTLAVRKPDPEPLFEAARRAGGDPALCLLVGDSDTDRNTAAAAGVPSVLVTFGPSGEDMVALNPEGLLERFEDLPEMVTRLLADV